MTLEEIVAALPEQVKVKLGIHFLEIGLPIWEKFAKESGDNLSYYAFMLGMETVKPQIINSSIQLAKQWISPQSSSLQEELKPYLKKLVDRFSMHLLGIKDWELELDPHPKLIFYSALNLLDYINGKTSTFSNESTIYVSINQSIDAIVKAKLLTWDEVNGILKNYK